MMEHDAPVQARPLDDGARLVAGTAIDLGQFVTRVRDAAERLAVVSSNPEVAAEVESLRAACDRAAELTGELRAVGHHDTSGPQRVDLTLAVSRLVTLLRRMVGPGTSVYVDCCSDRTPVLVDPVKLRRVLLHLVAQASDAMAGSGRVVVGTRLTPTGSILWVGDEGPPFDGQRAGLDLAGAKALLQEARGHVSLATSPAGGGQVEIRFPPG